MGYNVSSLTPSLSAALTNLVFCVFRRFTLSLVTGVRGTDTGKR